MKWMSKGVMPTEAGWYWQKCEGKKPFMMEVWIDTYSGNALSTYEGGMSELREHAFDDYFYGPLVPPPLVIGAEDTPINL